MPCGHRYLACGRHCDKRWCHNYWALGNAHKSYFRDFYYREKCREAVSMTSTQAIFFMGLGAGALLIIAYVLVELIRVVMK